METGFLMTEWFTMTMLNDRTCGFHWLCLSGDVS